MPDNIAKLLLASLLGSDDKNIAQNKNSLIEAIKRIYDKKMIFVLLALVFLAVAISQIVLSGLI